MDNFVDLYFFLGTNRFYVVLTSFWLCLSWQWALINSFSSNSNGTKNSTNGGRAWLTGPFTGYFKLEMRIVLSFRTSNWRCSLCTMCVVYRAVCFNYRKLTYYFFLGGGQLIDYWYGILFVLSDWFRFFLFLFPS